MKHWRLYWGSHSWNWQNQKDQKLLDWQPDVILFYHVFVHLAPAGASPELCSSSMKTWWVTEVKQRLMRSRSEASSSFSISRRGNNGGGCVQIRNWDPGCHSMCLLHLYSFILKRNSAQEVPVSQNETVIWLHHRYCNRIQLNLYIFETNYATRAWLCPSQLEATPELKRTSRCVKGGGKEGLQQEGGSKWQEKWDRMNFTDISKLHRCVSPKGNDIWALSFHQLCKVRQLKML